MGTELSAALAHLLRAMHVFQDAAPDGAPAAAVGEVLIALDALGNQLGPGDARTARQRRADALVELIAKAAADGHAGIENAAGLPPTLVVHVDVEQLAGPSPHRHRDADAGITAAREHGCCDASPRPGGVVAELGWGGPILRQSLERIGCTAQLVRLVTAGGRRVLDNLILLCRHHHRLVHEGRWTAASRHDDRVEYRDPHGLLHGSTPMPRSRGCG